MVVLENVTKIFSTRKGPLKALDDVSIRIEEGEFVVFRGPSGCGKTTLLLTIGGMQHPTSGTVSVDGRNLYALNSGERALVRRKTIGFVFQMFHLVPYLSVLDNVLLPAGKGCRREVLDLLSGLKLEGREDHKPSDLSAGERQRAAIARALIHRPKIILADEPTGNLDPENAAEVFTHLAEFQRGGGTVLVVTHGTAADGHASRIVPLRHGKIVNPDG